MTETEKPWIVAIPSALGDAVCSTPPLNKLLENCNGKRALYLAGPRGLRTIFEDLRGVEEYIIYEQLLSGTPISHEFEWFVDFLSTEKSETLRKSLKAFNYIYRDADDGRKICIDNRGNGKTIIASPIFNPKMEGRGGDPYEPAWSLEAPLAASVLHQDFWSWIDEGLEPRLDFATSAEALVDITDVSDAVFLVPCGSANAKRWPEKNWVRLAKALRNDGEKVILVLGPREKDVYKNLPELPDVRIYQDIDLRKLGAAFALGKLVIANDCGPMHLAAAQGIPTVGIFGPTNPRCWFCYSGDHQVFFQSPESFQSIDPWGVIWNGDEPWPHWIASEDVIEIIRAILIDNLDTKD